MGHDPAPLDFPGGPTDLRLVTLTRMAESGHQFASLVLTLDDSSVEQAIRAIGRIARGAFPFFLLMLLATVLITAFPEIALWLPQTLFDQ